MEEPLRSWLKTEGFQMMHNCLTPSCHDHAYEAGLVYKAYRFSMTGALECHLASIYAIMSGECAIEAAPMMTQAAARLHMFPAVSRLGQNMHPK